MTDIQIQQLPLQTLAASCLSFSAFRSKQASRTKAMLLQIEQLNAALAEQGSNPLIADDIRRALASAIAQLGEELLLLRGQARGLLKKAELVGVKAVAQGGKAQELEKGLALMYYCRGLAPWLRGKEAVLCQLVGGRYPIQGMRTLVLRWGAEPHLEEGL
jgi:hypothetical protein